MSSITALADSLPSSIPKLDSASLNWAIFSLHFQDAVEAKGYWGYFDGSTPCPTPITVAAEDQTMMIDNSPVEQWNKEERLAKSLLTQKIPDSALMKICNKKTVKDRWDTIVWEYTERHLHSNRAQDLFP